MTIDNSEAAVPTAGLVPQPATSNSWAAQPSNFTQSGRSTRTLNAIAQRLSAVETPRVLSFGCSEGLETLDMRAVWPKGEIHGTDIHLPSLEIARERGRDSGIVFYESTPTALREHGPYHAAIAMNVLVNWPASYGLDDISALYPFEKFNEAITTMVEALVPGGFLGVYNACYCVEHTSLGGKLKPVPMPKPKDNGWVDKFGPDSRRIAIACDVKGVPIAIKDWRKYMNNNAEDVSPRGVVFQASAPADCRTILWQKTA